MWYASGSGSTIQRITYANDGSVGTIRGNLGLGGTRDVALVGNNTAVWAIVNEAYLPASQNMMTRIEMASDTEAGVVKLTNPSDSYSAGISAYGNPYNAWMAGASSGPAGHGTMVYRMTYANDTNNWLTRGNLSNKSQRPIQTGNMTDMWLETNYGAYSNVNRIIYSTDTAAASVKSAPPYYFIGGAISSNITDAWYSNDMSNSVTIRYTYASETFISIGGRTVNIGRGGTAK